MSPKRIPRKLRQPVTGYALIVSLIVSVSLPVATLLIALRVNENSERKLCNTVISNIQAYAETPPTTETGINLARNWRELHQQLHCPSKIG